jgi:hypothetical protein
VGVPWEKRKAVNRGNLLQEKGRRADLSAWNKSLTSGELSGVNKLWEENLSSRLDECTHSGAETWEFLHRLNAVETLTYKIRSGSIYEGD